MEFVGVINQIGSPMLFEIVVGEELKRGQ